MTRHEAALAILEDVPSSENGRPQIAITVILAIIGTVVAVYSCLKDHPLFEADTVRKPNLLQKIRLRRIVRKTLAEHRSDLDADEVTAAILKLGVTISRDDLHQLLKEGDRA